MAFRSRRPPQSSRDGGFGRGRLLLIAGVVILVLLVVFARVIAGLYTDLLWFDSLGLGEVWWAMLSTKLALGLVFGVLFFALAYGNLAVVDRVAPRSRPPGAEEEALGGVHRVVERHRRLVRAIVVVIPAAFFGVAAATEWNDWLLFRHRVSFGTDDPQFGHDVGFYVFQLPFLSFVANWLCRGGRGHHAAGRRRRTT